MSAEFKMNCRGEMLFIKQHVSPHLLLVSINKRHSLLGVLHAHNHCLIG